MPEGDNNNENVPEKRTLYRGSKLLYTLPKYAFPIYFRGRLNSHSLLDCKRIYAKNVMLTIDEEGTIK